MYWIEVDFSNGKTLRKDSETLNETYKAYNRYCCKMDKKRNVRVIEIRAGNGEGQTFKCKH